MERELLDDDYVCLASGGSFRVATVVGPERKKRRLLRLREQSPR
jgi:hypothetical protein